MTQFTRKFIKARFQMLAKEVGWNIDHYFKRTEDAPYATRIGFVALEYSPYGGYFVTQVTSTTGAETNLNGGARMRGRELYAWFEGIRYARAHMPANLDVHAMKQAEYYKT